MVPLFFFLKGIRESKYTNARECCKNETAFHKHKITSYKNVNLTLHKRESSKYKINLEAQ